MIDADALTEELKGAIERNHKYHMVVIDNDFKTLIDDAPTIDPVRHGRWIDMNTATDNYYPRYKCSVCDYGANYSNFCPNCGARMDGDEND